MGSWLFGGLIALSKFPSTFLLAHNGHYHFFRSDDRHRGRLHTIQPNH